MGNQEKFPGGKSHISECMGIIMKILRVTALKTDVGGWQYTLTKMMTEILEDEEKIVEQTKNKVYFLGKECITLCRRE